MKIVWSPNSVEKLEAIHAYISEDKVLAADNFVKNIIKTINTIPDFPKRHRIVPEAKRGEIREIIFDNYRIIFRISDLMIEILTIRNFKQLLVLDELGIKIKKKKSRKTK